MSIKKYEISSSLQIKADKMADQLSFLNLWDSWDVIDEISCKSRKTTEILSGFLKEVTSFNASAAKTFQKLGSLSLGDSEIGSFQSFLYTFKGLNETVAATLEIVGNNTQQLVCCVRILRYYHSGTHDCLCNDRFASLLMTCYCSSQIHSVA